MPISSITMSGMRAIAAKPEVSAEDIAHAQPRGQISRTDGAPSVNPAATPYPRVHRAWRSRLDALGSNKDPGAETQPAAPATSYEPEVARAAADAATERLEHIRASSEYRHSAALIPTEGARRQAVEIIT